MSRNPPAIALPTRPDGRGAVGARTPFNMCSR
jgi:hypothetical protein